MVFNIVKCWQIKSTVCDLERITTEEPDLLLVKKSILKNAYRAFCLNKREEVEKSKWYKNQIEGGKTRFYIDGSGLYELSNLDLSESEFYFSKYHLSVGYRPWIFLSWQSDYTESSHQIKELTEETIDEININRRPRSPLELISSTRQEDGAEDITKAIKSNLDRCLISIFDITNVADVLSNNKEATKSYPNANVIYELSYALQKKQPNQIIIVKQERDDIANNDVPFDFRQNKHLSYRTTEDLKKSLKPIIISTLQKMGHFR